MRGRRGPPRMVWVCACVWACVWPVASLLLGGEAVRLECTVAGPCIEHDEGLGAGDAAATPQLLYDLTKALHVGHLQPDECVRVAGRGEHRLHLGELHRRLLDLLQVGGPGEAHFGEGLNRATGLAVVDDDRVA